MMRDRSRLAGFAWLAVLAIAPLTGLAQAPAPGLPRTPDGKPNLEGIFNFSTITPLQRPDALAGKTTLSDEEAAAFEDAGEHAAQSRPVRPDQRAAERGLPATSRRRRAVVQRVLVRARQPADEGQAHVPHRRSCRTGGFR